MITLFLVDDNKDIIYSINELLKDVEDFSIIGKAYNSTDAINQIEQLKPDVVLMDVLMPDIDGITCVKTLKPKLPNTQFIMFSVVDTDEKIFEAIKVGATSYVIKNCDNDELKETIIGVYAGESPMNGDIARKMINILQNRNKPNKNLSVTKKEGQILELLAKGLTYIEIADQTNITVKTLKGHIYRLYEKLHVDNRTEAVNKYYGKH